jgi:hypothetical protein
LTEESRVPFLAGARGYFFLLSVQIDSGAHSVPYSVSTRGDLYFLIGLPFDPEEGGKTVSFYRIT